MRKVFKKVATLAVTSMLLAAMTVPAFADDEHNYAFVGSPYLFGADNNTDNSELGWCPTSENQFFEAAEGDDMDGILVFTSTSSRSSAEAEAECGGTYDEIAEAKGAGVADNSLTFKILQDANDFAWSWQMQLGYPPIAWADNQSQFRIMGLEQGEFKVYLSVDQGFVAVIQNGKYVDLNVRFHTRDEDSWFYSGLSQSEIIASDTEGAYTTDNVPDIFAKGYEEFVNKCLAAEGGEPMTFDTADASDDDASADTSADTAKKSSTSSDDDSSSSKTPVVVIAVIAVIAIIAGIFGLKKKNA